MARLFFALIYFCLVQDICTQKQAVGPYHAASVEYSRGSGRGTTPLERAVSKAEGYTHIIKKIADEHQIIDVIIFPEGTLVEDLADNIQGIEAMSIVPKAADQIIPCNSTTGGFTEYLKLLSCAAEKYKTYLVINMKEKSPCQKGKECRSSGLNYYNTDVVFDREGRVIARYRKYNLFLEGITDQPEKPEVVTFKTDFGKTFGLFTCFDILFESPAMDLVRAGVNNFIYPSLWVPGLPLLTELQTQQMFAQGLDVTLLSSGASYPIEGSGGAVFYIGNKGILAENHGPRGGNPYIYGAIPEKENFNPTCNTDVDDEKAKQMDGYTLLQEDLTNYTYKKLDLESSRIIEETLYQQGEDGRILRCDFNIGVEIDKAEMSSKRSKYEYFIVARSGRRYYGMKHYQNYIEVCGLIACAGPNLENCGKRLPNYEDISWPRTFSNIQISGYYNENRRRSQFPNSLLADFVPLPPPCTTWTSEKSGDLEIKRTFSTNVPVKKLLTFAIFGRNYDKDGDPKTYL